MNARRFVTILCVSLAVATVLRFAAHYREQSLQISRPAPVAKLPDPAQIPRKIYPYSVIPGGAYSSEELAVARRIDRVVAAHYSDFETGAVTVRALPEDRYFYISYRKSDRVYWTANKRRVPKGEIVLSDGKHLARTRCGNRLSEAPQLPIAAGPQPTETALNGPEVPPEIELPQAPLFAAQYDAPAMPLVDARERFFEFPAGATGASPLEAFPAFGLHSPMMEVANLPFGTPQPGAATGPHGSTPGGSTPGTPSGGGPIPGAPVPEPASIALMLAAVALLILRYRELACGRKPPSAR
jgi:hypothetical protein